MVVGIEGFFWDFFKMNIKLLVISIDVNVCLFFGDL